MGAEHAHQSRWPEFVDDLWQRHLPHLRQEAYGDGEFMFDPTTGRYGFQEGSDYGTEDEFMTDLMNEPEYQGEGERGRDTEEGAMTTGGEGGDESRHDADDSFEELNVSDSEFKPVISHSIDLDQMSGDEEDEESTRRGGGASFNILDEEGRK